MLNTIAIFALGGLLTAFAICAASLNAGAHAARRGGALPGPEAPPRKDDEPLDLNAGVQRDGRRLAVGDFLFGALYLRGEEPLPFGELAEVAAEAGLDISQTLSWLARAEESGLIERVEQPGETGEAAVRLSGAGLDVARSNRRAAAKSARVT